MDSLNKFIVKKTLKHSTIHSESTHCTYLCRNRDFEGKKTTFSAIFVLNQLFLWYSLMANSFLAGRPFCLLSKSVVKIIKCNPHANVCLIRGFLLYTHTYRHCFEPINFHFHWLLSQGNVVASWGNCFYGFRENMHRYSVSILNDFWPRISKCK